MRKLVLFFVVVFAAAAQAQQPARSDVARWERRARAVTIIRDDWGIPHIYGKTDADVVFGTIYAQAEDDFNRIETNYLNSLGRLAEAEGESAIYTDLRQQLFIVPDTLKRLYRQSPSWLRALMDAWADGLNYYLHTHPATKPRVLTHFEPWMALSFSEGSIGGDIETISPQQLAAFYGDTSAQRTSFLDTREEKLPSGSNGIAIAPSNTANRHTLFLINPHTTFYFRAEAQMVSEEGLNAYGAMTWGQFFIYQGFNERAGWMHTSSAVDAIDWFKETIVRKGGRIYYRHGDGELPVITRRITIPFKTANGLERKEFTVYHTHHGPVVREIDGQWTSVSLMNSPVKALTQSYTRTKARSLREFRQTMELHTNSSNNTIFADADGNIAYFHANFIPKRNPRFNWSEPVDGSNPATDWGAVLGVEESPLVVNPASGWVYNSNDSPWNAAGPNSPRPESFPPYVDNGVQSARGRHAVRVLQGRQDFTMESLRKAAYDEYVVGFDDILPQLFRAYEMLPGADSLKSRLAEQVAMLQAWDRRWSTSSVPTSLAVYFSEALPRAWANSSWSADQLLNALQQASEKLTADFGTWKTPWGEINRIQRLTGDVAQRFDDAAPSLPVPMTSGRTGSLASFEARPGPQTKRRYGRSGNSFVAIVEFGDSVKAIAIMAGGQSGDPRSRHFFDQAERYARGDLRPVYFYRSQLAGHTERTYHPGASN